METSLPDAPQRRVNGWIRAYAEREAELIDRIVDLEGERDRYREIAQVALGQLHVGTQQSDRMRATIQRQQETIRQLLDAQPQDSRDKAA